VTSTAQILAVSQNWAVFVFMGMQPRIDMMANALGATIGKRIFNLNQAIEKSSLARSTQALVTMRASQINGCGYCLDLHTKEAAAAGETAVRINLVATWHHASVFSDAERAALALVEEGTRLADATHAISDETWSQVRAHYDDDQIIALVSLIALINATNRLGVIFGNVGGSYVPGAFAGMANGSEHA
jgi:AhpD family alkylhydroperoxidase